MADFMFVVFQSAYNKKYLRVTNGEDDGLPTGFLSFNGADIADPATKFEWEPAESADAKRMGFKHIRSCYNNKYLVRQMGGSYTDAFIAKADKPEEDQSIPSCTLFKPEVNELTYGIQHVQTGRYTYLVTSNVFPMKLGSTSLYDNPSYLYTLVNWENLVFFPQRVAFKGDNDNYVNVVNADGHPFLQSQAPIKDDKAEFEVTMIGNGYVRIRSLWNGKFWKRGNSWIWADSSDSSDNNPDTMFLPVKVGDNLVALQNMGNMNFCKRHSYDGFTNCLNAAISLITSNTNFVVEDAVVSRSLYNYNFQLSNARIYNESLIALITTGASNDSDGTEPRTLTLELTYKDIKTSTWSNSVSLKAGVESTIKVDVIPLIVQAEVKLSTEIADAYEWGKTSTTETEVKTTYTVSVPPKTKTTVTLTAIKALCDVPFSYTQSDVLSDGTNVIKTLRDGVFKGSNYFNFNFDEKQEKLKIGDPSDTDTAIA